MRSIWAVRRSATDHKVSGLAAGIARHWNVDPVLLRVGFVVLAFAGGIGAVLYAAGWLMVPLDGQERSQLDDLVPATRSWSRELRVGIVAAICLLCLAASSWVVPFVLAAAAVLAAVWYFGYYKHRSPQPSTPDPAADNPEQLPTPPEPEFFDYSGPETPFTEAARGWQARIVAEQQARTEAAGEPTAASRPAGSGMPDADSTTGEHPAAAGFADDAPAWSSDVRGPDPERAAYLATPDPVGLYDPAGADNQPATQVFDRMRLARRRSARKLGLVTVITIGLVLAGLGVASSAGIGIPVSGYLAAVLLVLGAALLVGTKYGRPPGAILAAVLVALAMVTSLAVVRPAIVGQNLGVRTMTYRSAAALPKKSDHLDIGQLSVNLAELTPPGNGAADARHGISYRATVDAGRLTVVLPKNMKTTVRAKVSEGALTIPGHDQREGTNLTATTREAPAQRTDGGPKPRLTLHLRVKHGQLEVRR